MVGEKQFRYKVVYDGIKKEIDEGLIQENALFPSENEIAQRYNVNRSTVRKAMQMLVDEGLVEKLVGKGSVLVGENSSKPISKNTSSNRNIGFLLPSGNTITEQFYSTMFYNLEKELQSRGFSLIYSTLDADSDLQQIIMSCSLDGCFFVSNVDDKHIDNALSSGIPCVLINGYSPKIPSVMSDNEKGAYLAGKHLLDMGHRNIVVVSGIRSYASNQERLYGFRRALTESGILDEDLTVLVAKSWEQAAGTQCVLEYLNKCGKLPTAIFGLNDRLAFGAMQAAYHFGLSVPEDISIIGYDNLNMMLSVRRLTTIEAHIEMMAEVAAENLLWQFNGGSCMPIRINAPTELVLGETIKRVEIE